METLFLVTIATFFIGALCSLLLQSDGKLAIGVSNGFAMIGSVLAMIMAGSVLVTKSALFLSFSTSFSLFTISITVDMLSAFFVLIIATVSLASSFYGMGYMQKYVKQYNVGVFGFFYNLFIASLLLVVSAHNGLYFLFVWELMSLTSYFLVIFENKKIENIKAGFLYLVMTHAGTAFIILAFLLLYTTTGSFDFSVIKQHGAGIPLFAKNAIFLFALIGFGTKAGIIPLHIWLPRAHPAAPSHVSALMSGVMIKTAILMLMRLFLDLIPVGQLWWGPVILIIGAISSLLGVLYALSEHDIKKLLAYHSVENIGIILLGLGSAMTFYSLNVIPLAIVAVSAALYHTMNHAIFKSLLFLGAGSVVAQTHTHNIEKYGGLIKKMPYTALFFLIGSVAISALPPFNGFASEWLTYQSLFAGIVVQSVFVKGSFVVAIASLAFTGGLAAACFVKAFGITFLAKPRSKESEQAKESPFFMTISMGFLAILCFVLGIFATSIIPHLMSIAQTLGTMQRFSPVTRVASFPLLQVSQGITHFNLSLVFIALLSVLVVVVFLVYLKTKNQKVKMVDTWDCGAPPLTTRAEITATAFARSLMVMFGGIMQPSKQSIIENPEEVKYFPRSKTVRLEVPNLYEQRLYRPLPILLRYVSSKVAFLHNGNVNQYLLYIFITLLGLLIWSAY